MLFTNILGESRINAILAIGVAAVIYFAAIVLLGALERDDFEFIPMGSKLIKVFDKLHLIKILLRTKKPRVRKKLVKIRSFLV